MYFVYVCVSAMLPINTSHLVWELCKNREQRDYIVLNQNCNWCTKYRERSFNPSPSCSHFVYDTQSFFTLLFHCCLSFYLYIRLYLPLHKLFCIFLNVFYVCNWKNRCKCKSNIRVVRDAIFLEIDEKQSNTFESSAIHEASEYNYTTALNLRNVFCFLFYTILTVYLIVCVPSVCVNCGIIAVVSFVLLFSKNHFGVFAFIDIDGERVSFLLCIQCQTMADYDTMHSCDDCIKYHTNIRVKLSMENEYNILEVKHYHINKLCICIHLCVISHSKCCPSYEWNWFNTH